jgi:hypothetical protein
MLNVHNRSKISQWWVVNTRIWTLHCISRFNCHWTVIQFYLNIFSILIQIWFFAFLSQKIRFITTIGICLLTTRTWQAGLSYTTLAFALLPSVASTKNNIHRYRHSSWFYPHNKWFSQKYCFCSDFWTQFEISDTGSRKSKMNLNILQLTVRNQSVMRWMKISELSTNSSVQFSG